MINRREFLKVAPYWVAGIFVPERFCGKKEIDVRNDASFVPVIEYHDMNFKIDGAVMKPEIFTAQMEFIKKFGFRTLTAKDVVNFIEGKEKYPRNSLVLRFDLGNDVEGKDGQSNWYEIFQVLEKNGLHGIFFIMPSAIENSKYGLTWNLLAEMQNKGVISVCSHGLNHPNFKNIDDREAYKDVWWSKQIIEEKMRKAGSPNFEVLGFAYPYDSVPDKVNFLSGAGYRFAMGGNLYGHNRANIPYGRPEIRFKIPSLYPYVLKERLDVLDKNQHYYPGLEVIGTGQYISFADVLVANMTPVSLENLKNPKHYQACKERFLPPNAYLKNSLFRPQMIVLHTDDQDGNNYRRWNTDTTYNGLLGREMAVHFGVGPGNNEIVQFVPSYKDNSDGRVWLNRLPFEKGGAIGVNGIAVSIEMTGRGFNRILTTSDRVLEDTINRITNNCLNLVLFLIKKFNINLSNVVGHFEVTNEGKTDPGKDYMEYFRKKLREKLN